MNDLRKIILLASAMVFLGGTISYAEAHRYPKRPKAVVDRPWEKKADQNKDGVVGPKEAREHVKERAVVDKPWEEKADRNEDGKVDRVEAKGFFRHVADANKDGKVDAQEREAYWLKRKSKVNTPLERKYDANRDGEIDSTEAKGLLKERLHWIRAKGKAKVDSAIEKEFDVNQDGYIDRSEVEDLEDAIK